jgi:3'(2'),5'-bisphosphate nucleotidase
MTIDHQSLLDVLIKAALAGGKEVMWVYDGTITVTEKADSSPQTEADIRAEKIILEHLAIAYPDIPTVAEESAAAGETPDDFGDRFFLVDPLDGTKEFVNRNGEFTVNIALVDKGVPVAGVVYAPAINRLFLGSLEAGAFEARVELGAVTGLAPIHIRPRPVEGLTVVASRSHRGAETDRYLEAFNVAELKPAGSSLKFCVVAAGEADLYPRHGPTMEWDTAAGHAVLIAAGGTVETEDGAPLTYGKPGFRNPYFIAKGDV